VVDGVERREHRRALALAGERLAAPAPAPQGRVALHPDHERPAEAARLLEEANVAETGPLERAEGKDDAAPALAKAGADRPLLIDRALGAGVAERVRELGERHRRRADLADGDARRLVPEARRLVPGRAGGERGGEGGDE